MPILLLGVTWPAPLVTFQTKVWKRFSLPYPIIYSIPIAFLGELCALLTGDLILCTIIVVS